MLHEQVVSLPLEFDILRPCRAELYHVAQLLREVHDHRPMCCPIGAERAEFLVFAVSLLSAHNNNNNNNGEPPWI